MEWQFQPMDEVEEPFKKYLENIEPKLKLWIDGQQSSIDDVLHLLLTYYYYFNFVADSRILTGAHHGTLMLASKTATDLLATHLCLSNGCIFQASVILRSLFETAVTTKFIYQDFNARMELF